jgi:hypothetical protein
MCKRQNITNGTRYSTSTWTLSLLYPTRYHDIDITDKHDNQITIIRMLIGITRHRKH